LKLLRYTASRLVPVLSKSIWKTVKYASATRISVILDYHRISSNLSLQVCFAPLKQRLRGCKVTLFTNIDNTMAATRPCTYTATTAKVSIALFVNSIADKYLANRTTIPILSTTLIPMFRPTATTTTRRPRRCVRSRRLTACHCRLYCRRRSRRNRRPRRTTSRHRLRWARRPRRRSSPNSRRIYNNAAAIAIDHPTIQRQILQYRTHPANDWIFTRRPLYSGGVKWLRVFDVENRFVGSKERGVGGAFA